MLVHAFIASRVDYCNSLLYGVPAYTIRRLQAVMNAAARLIVGIHCFDHITPVLRDVLHWLPVQQRIEYKIALLMFKCSRGCGPAYLVDCCVALSADSLGHNLRSVSHGDVCHPRTLTRRLGLRSFRSSGPSVWNSLPVHLKDPTLSVNVFK